MTWVAVRCCCTPTKVLGFLRLPARDIKDGAIFAVRNRATREPSVVYDPHAPIAPVDRAVVRLLSDFRDGRRSGELAIYSEDRPLEWWRRIDGFVEAVGRPT